MRFNIALRQLEEQPSGIAETACHMCGVWNIKEAAPYLPLTENYFVKALDRLCTCRFGGKGEFPPPEPPRPLTSCDLDLGIVVMVRHNFMGGLRAFDQVERAKVKPPGRQSDAGHNRENSSPCDRALKRAESLTHAPGTGVVSRYEMYKHTQHYNSHKLSQVVLNQGTRRCPPPSRLSRVRALSRWRQGLWWQGPQTLHRLHPSPKGLCSPWRH